MGDGGAELCSLSAMGYLLFFFSLDGRGNVRAARRALGMRVGIAGSVNVRTLPKDRWR
jgi:hypothetical protein